MPNQPKPSDSDLASDRRESLRSNLELPLSWCRLERRVNASVLANKLGLEAWYSRQQALGELDSALQHEIEHVQDSHAAAALRILETAVRRLAEPLVGIKAENTLRAQSIGAPTLVNLSVDGVSFAVPDTGENIEPRNWLGVALQLPDSTPLLACLEVVWIGHADQKLHIGGRFHHVLDGCAKKLARTLLVGNHRGNGVPH